MLQCIVILLFVKFLVLVPILAIYFNEDVLGFAEEIHITIELVRNKVKLVFELHAISRKPIISHSFWVRHPVAIVRKFSVWMLLWVFFVELLLAFGLFFPSFWRPHLMCVYFTFLKEFLHSS